MRSQRAPPSPLLPQTEGVEALLSSRMALRIEVMVPPPYSRIPGPFLAGATRVILDAVIAQLYPRFLELLAQDYRTWARGDARNAQEGELIGAGTAQE